MSMTTTYQTVKVADRRTGSALNVFYSEAGLKDAPVALLLMAFLAPTIRIRASSIGFRTSTASSPTCQASASPMRPRPKPLAIPSITSPR